MTNIQIGTTSGGRSIESEDRRQQAAAQQQQSGQSFNRAYGVCLEAKGYKVG